MDSYRTVYRGGSGEIIVKKSRFIAEVYPVTSEEEAMNHLEEVRKRYWDARHHCWAFITGLQPPVERMSDDGEPAGTAGKPILEVIRGQGLTNVFVVVTRYFGGTLLGTGGLVRAYTEAAAEGLRQSSIIEKIHGSRVRICTDYTLLGKLQYMIGQRGLHLADSIYTDKVELYVMVPDACEKAFAAEITEGTGGKVQMEKVEECWFADTGEGIVVYAHGNSDKS